MSQAELAAYKFYTQHRLNTMSEDVKKHLIILMLSTPSEEPTDADSLCDITPLTANDVEARLGKAEEDMRLGRTHSCAAVHAEMESKFPWLCE